MHWRAFICWFSFGLCQKLETMEREWQIVLLRGVTLFFGINLKRAWYNYGKSIIYMLHVIFYISTGKVLKTAIGFENLKG